MDYVPPKVWEYKDSAGSKWAMNRPTAGSRFERELPTGRHPLQLYSMATPNGQKITILLEELLEIGISQAEYDAWPIKIGESEQFGSGFVAINPNSKIPALLDQRPSNGQGPLRVFESGAILLYLADKFGHFLPSPSENLAARTEVLNWLFWLQGSAPFLGGGFGHFFHYADVKQEYPINRFTMETKRQLDVLDRQLQDNEYVAGDFYSIADMAVWPWYGSLVLDREYKGAATFLNVESDYPHVLRWAKQIFDRPTVRRGRKVNRFWDDLSDQLHERHDASDFDTKTADKLKDKKTSNL